jgi:hypothetical protein
MPLRGNRFRLSTCRVPAGVCIEAKPELGPSNIAAIASPYLVPSPGRRDFGEAVRNWVSPARHNHGKVLDTGGNENQSWTHIHSQYRFRRTIFQEEDLTDFVN